MKEILLINVSGEDKPGVTSTVTTLLSQFEATVLDIGQAVIHDQLNLAILAAVPAEAEIDDVTSGVQACLAPLAMRAKFLPISDERYQNWVEQQGKNPFITLAVPDAAFRLVQASGRLSRSEADTGRITLFDERIVTKRYGKQILAPLPPYRQEVFVESYG